MSCAKYSRYSLQDVPPDWIVRDAAGGSASASIGGGGAASRSRRRGRVAGNNEEDELENEEAVADREALREGNGSLDADIRAGALGSGGTGGLLAGIGAIDGRREPEGEFYDGEGDFDREREVLQDDIEKQPTAAAAPTGAAAGADAAGGGGVVSITDDSLSTTAAEAEALVNSGTDGASSSSSSASAGVSTTPDVGDAIASRDSPSDAVATASAAVDDVAGVVGEYVDSLVASTDGT